MVWRRGRKNKSDLDTWRCDLDTWRYVKEKSTTLSLFGSKSKVKAKGGGRLQAVKSVTELGKCFAISDGDWTVFPTMNHLKLSDDSHVE